MAAILPFLTISRPAARTIGTALFLSVMSAGIAHAQTVVAIVNGEPITQLDVDQRSKLMEVSSPTHKAPPRTEVLDELINEKLEIREAKRWGIEASDDDVSQAVTQQAQNRGQKLEEFVQMMKQAGIAPQTFRARLRAQIVWVPLVRGRFQSALESYDKDPLLQEMMDKMKPDDSGNYDYTLRPILFIVPPNSTAAVYDDRKREAEDLRGKFRGCDQGIPYARSLGSVVVRDQINRASADVPPEARKSLDSVPVGQLTAPEITKLGIEMFAICAKEAAKGDGSANKKQAKEALFNEKFEAQAKKYLAQLHREALIEYPPSPAGK